ncbi:MAG: SCO family protein [Flavobacteriaceae bacterium]|jgi:protein SCO1|nr:SCO family protein [Pelagibacterales bacterium]MBT4959595.1 SCO family protein [Flavobacteriaceae bacterium]MBT6169996.1 SCO family protein [Flavobacteriaceae bacterium]MBT6448554.1 SCO family protein [Flavobacteriaceae bacterium]MBT7624597.1 SCO family protein [Flavobacteriaceae bacterium]|tara:strand:- start:559 stop:1191 length:633 start_codon:yes stop_codon:yes gene_type:complete
MYKLIYIFVLSITFNSCNQISKKQLPIYNPIDINPKLVDKSVRNISENHTVRDFNLINQNGANITSKDYENKIYVVDFFFTRCPSICPIMTNNMLKIQEEFIKNEDIMLLSMSVTPEIDSVEILKNYAIEKGVNDSKWNITTGSKKHIYELARKSYFAVVEQGDGGLQDFIHTPNFILVDTKKQIRGIYDGTEENEISRLIEDIYVLANK